MKKLTKFTLLLIISSNKVTAYGMRFCKSFQVSLRNFMSQGFRNYLASVIGQLNQFFSVFIPANGGKRSTADRQLKLSHWAHSDYKRASKRYLRSVNLRQLSWWKYHPRYILFSCQSTVDEGGWPDSSGNIKADARNTQKHLKNVLAVSSYWWKFLSFVY